MKKSDKIDRVLEMSAIYSIITSLFVIPSFILSLFQEWYTPKVITHVYNNKTYVKFTEQLNVFKLVATIMFIIIVLILTTFAIWRVCHERKK